MRGVVTSARVTHETAVVDELALATPPSQTEGVRTLLSAPAVSEAFVLSTCNRVEAYVVAPTPREGRDALAAFLADVPDDAVTVAGHEASLRHLLRVACGLESVVLGEDQIIGQVRRAYEDARTADGVGDLLEATVTKAIHVGERARTETTINEGIVSLGSAAVRLAGETIDLEGAATLVVGAGEMGQLAANALESTDVGSISVANRTLERARELRGTLDVPGEAVPLSELGDRARSATVIVTATGSDEPVLDATDLGEGEQVIVDLGQPRDVDPAAAAPSSTTVYDLDDLESITSRTHDRRRSAAEAVAEIVDREFERLLTQLKRQRADQVIAAMYESASRIKRREVETALGRLDDRGPISDEQREIVESMADAVVNQLLAAPTRSLREAAVADDWETIDTALRLFDPAIESADEEPRPTPSGRDEPPSGSDEPPIGAVEDD